MVSASEPRFFKSNVVIFHPVLWWINLDTLDPMTGCMEIWVPFGYIYLHLNLGGGSFKYFLFSPLFVEDFQFD